MSDLIDRDALIEDIKSWDIELDDMTSDGDLGYHSGIVRAIRVARKAPAVEAEPVRRGEWILGRDEMRNLYTTCDNCKTCVWLTNGRHGMKVDMRGANYCPNCGAKMDKEEQDG